MPATRHELASDASPRISVNEGWTLHEYTVCTSTNLVAASLPVWSAVRADTQTKGRGRFERDWVSDEGGLWLSAVLPVGANLNARRFLPVATGLAVCEALASLGARGLRLRWPNDVMVGNRKLCGLLLDQFAPDRVVAGIGINVANHPESRDGSLTGQTIRLCDLITAAPTLPALALRVLCEVRSVSAELDARGSEHFLTQLNSLWHAPRRVTLDLDGREVRGDFVGVDASGRLELTQAGERSRFFEPEQVRCLREIHD
ncbi:MAG: biotin--[acetyl-CoA-carboxylase] ligase [Limisphaerales bacterium]